MYYPEFIHPECVGRPQRTDIFISQRDMEGAMKVYGGQSNMVVAGNTVYLRKTSNGDFFRLVGSSWVWVGGPGRQFVGTDVGVFAMSPDGQLIMHLPNNSTTWTQVGGVAAQLFACRHDRICKSSPSTGNVSQFNGTGWSTIGGPGKKFVYGFPAGLYALTPNAVDVFQYTGSGQNWNWFGGSNFSDIVAATSGVYVIHGGSSHILKLINGQFTWIGGPGAQFDGGNGLIGLTPDKSAVMEFNANTQQWRQIGGPAARIDRLANGTTVALSPAYDLWTLAPGATAWTFLGKP